MTYLLTTLGALHDGRHKSWPRAMGTLALWVSGLISPPHLSRLRLRFRPAGAPPTPASSFRDSLTARHCLLAVPAPRGLYREHTFSLSEYPLRSL